MLFDLQSPGRRRAIRIIYGLLAGIMFIGFVGFGIGTAGNGPLSDLFGGGGGSSNSNAFDSDIKAAEQKLAANPNDTAALASLVSLHYQAGNQDVDSNGQLNSNGEQQFQQGADAWNKYVKLTRGNVAPGPSLLALQTFDRLGSTSFQKARTSTSASEALTNLNAGISDWKEAASVQQILIEKQRTASNYARLAQYLYLSGQTQAGDQAASKAKTTGQGTQASTIDTQLKSIKQLGTQLQAALAQLTKQQKQSQAATGGGNPLGGLGGSSGGISPGGLGGGGLSGGQ